jgi:hypothetical protein
MFKGPKKYRTICSQISSTSIIFDRVYEAINESEATGRAFLNCMKEYNNKKDISVSVEKL